MYNNLPFLPEIMKIEKCEKPVCNLYSRKNYVVHIISLKQALNDELILQKKYRVNKFNQKPWLKEYSNMNIDLTTKSKNYFEKDFFKLDE